MDTDAAIEELLWAVFSVEFRSELYEED
jgi:hypothetical protein